VLQTSGTFPYHGQHRVLKALFDRAWGNAVVAGAAALVAVSEAEARDLPRAARVVPNGVLPAGTAVRTRSAGRSRLLFVGSDRLQKRGHRLPALLDALPDAELHLVGPMGDRFRHLFDRFGDRVRAHGVLAGDALAGAYADADVVVFPAVGDAFGLVPFEAALAGTVAVVAGGHGCGEWFARAGGGVVPPDDDRALAEAVRARLADPAQRRRESQAVAAFVTRHLTWEEAAARTLSLYGDVLEGRA
jgi:glycosyltransferase involved in cell wall biosynthesis